MLVSIFFVYCLINQLVVGCEVYIGSVECFVVIVVSFECDLDILQHVYNIGVLVNIDADFNSYRYQVLRITILHDEKKFNNQI